MNLKIAIQQELKMSESNFVEYRGNWCGYKNA